jgi:hypothetical protein
MLAAVVVIVGTIDSELQFAAALRRAAREWGGPLSSMDVADALLDERCEVTGFRTRPGV